jgi:hypothetical protein
MARELEDRIQQLCARVAATDDDEELSRLCMELRDALNEHINYLREQVSAYRNSSNKRAPMKGDNGRDDR